MENRQDSSLQATGFSIIKIEQTRSPIIAIRLTIVFSYYFEF